MEKCFHGMKARKILNFILGAALLLSAGCAPAVPVVKPTTTISSIYAANTAVPQQTATSSPTDAPGAAVKSTAAPEPSSTAVKKPAGDGLTIEVDTEKNVHPISPLIYGISGADAKYLQALRPTLNSWGGNPNTRYNWKIGHAWNAGRDFQYRNGNYGLTGSASDQFIIDTQAVGAVVRLAVPTLGWVAKDDNINHCSFPNPDGSCGDAGWAKCDQPGQIADPKTANTPSDTNSITEWMRHLVKEQSFDLRFVAMDNEPELWGVTHYDVHPDCTTYQEILDKYLAYSAAVHSVAPKAELTGPVTCCWYYYWESAAGKLDKALHKNQEFLPWFLDQVRANDQKTGWRSLNVLDIHFYPDGVYNANVDADTAAHRLRSTRSLWDPTYVDESWINEPISLIPRMKQLIKEHYAETKLGLSEWNWGGDADINGAVTIADILGIFGREDLYFAAYWRYPELNSPGFYAFKMYTNYDDQGIRFGDTSVLAQSEDVDSVASYAALDSKTGNLNLMLINKKPKTAIKTQVKLTGFVGNGTAAQYRYDPSNLKEIVKSNETIGAAGFTMNLPAYSITLLVIPKK